MSAPTVAARAVAPPTFLQIEPVGQCNLRCRMRAIRFRDDGPSDGALAVMPYETFTRLLDESGTVHELHLQGLGEPLLHPRFFDLVEYAANKGIKVTTNSNLTLLRPWLAERCVTSGLAYLRVSIDGATADTYERIRDGGRFRRVVRNLEAVVAARRLRRSRRPAIGLVMVLMRQNLHELPDLVRLAHRWSVDDLFVQHLCHDFGESSLPARYAGMRDFVRSRPWARRTVRSWRTISTEPVGRLMSWACPSVSLRCSPARYTPRCDWPWRGMYISYQGYAMPCCMVGTPDRIHFGNGVDRGLQTIWESDDYRVFREQLNSDDPPEICRSCSVYKGIF